MPKRANTSLKYDQIYDFIVSFKQEHDGCAPTIREIGDAVGVSSTSMVNTYLDRMVVRGMIERKGKFRMIEIPGARWLPPAHLKAGITEQELREQDAERLLEVVLPR